MDTCAPDHRLSAESRYGARLSFEPPGMGRKGVP